MAGSVAQRERALSIANERRLARAAQRRVMRSLPWVDACQLFVLLVLLVGGPYGEHLEGAKLGYMLQGLPLMGRIRTRRYLSSINLREDVLLGDLTERQISQIADTVQCARSTGWRG